MSEQPTQATRASTAAAAKARAKLLAALGKGALLVVLVVGGVSFMLPLAWMVSTSLKAKGAVFTYPPEWLPRRQVTALAPDVEKVDGEWRQLRKRELAREHVVFVVTKWPTEIYLIEPTSRHGERAEVDSDWLEQSHIVTSQKRVYHTEAPGYRRRVVECRNIENAKVVMPCDSSGNLSDAILTYPLYRDAGGKLEPNFKPIRELHVQWDNYPQAWNALTLQKPWLAFSVPYSLRFKLGSNTYQVGPVRFGGFRIKSAFAVFYLNSVLVAVCVTVGQVFTSSLAAYAFARLRFPGRDRLFLGYLGTLMVPYVVTMIPVFVLLRMMHLVDTYAALILPAMFSAYGTFMLRQFFLTIPRELEDAARIDGCGKWGIYMNVILPLSKPALATLTTFVFLSNWNSFMWPLIVISSPEKRTLPIGLHAFMGANTTEWSLLMAASLMVMVPVLVVFMLGQRYFVKGIVLSGLKG